MTYRAYDTYQLPANDFAVFLMRLGFAILALAIPTVMPFSRRAIFILFPAGTIIILLASLLSAGSQDSNHKSVFLNPSAIALGFLVCWAALSLLWTPSLSEAALKLAKFSGTLLLLALVMSFILTHVRAADIYLIPASLALCAIFTQGQLVATYLSANLSHNEAALAQLTSTGGDTEGSFLTRTTLTLTILLWPAMKVLVLRERYSLAGCLSCLIASVLFINGTGLILLSVLIGVLTLSLAVTDAQRTAFWLGLLGAMTFIAGPFAPLLVKHAITHHLIANTVIIKPWTTPLLAWADIIRLDPLRVITGYGLDASVSELHARSDFSIIAPSSLVFEIWFELGVLGALGMAMFIFLAARTVGQLNHYIAPYILANFATVIVLIVSGLVTTQLWWVTLLCTNLLMINAVIRGQKRILRPKAKILTARDEDY